jgi:hypothetical protein
MRYDTIYNYDYLLNKIQDRYKETTLNKNINAFCKEVYYLTTFKFKLVVLTKRAYFLQNEITKMSKTLNLTDDEIIKCFYTEEKKQ